MELAGPILHSSSIFSGFNIYTGSWPTGHRLFGLWWDRFVLIVFRAPLYCPVVTAQNEFIQIQRWGRRVRTRTTIIDYCIYNFWFALQTLMAPCDKAVQFSKVQQWSKRITHVLWNEDLSNQNNSSRLIISKTKILRASVLSNLLIHQKKTLFKLSIQFITSNDASSSIWSSDINLSPIPCWELPFIPRLCLKFYAEWKGLSLGGRTHKEGWKYGIEAKDSCSMYYLSTCCKHPWEIHICLSLMSISYSCNVFDNRMASTDRIQNRCETQTLQFGHRLCKSHDQHESSALIIPVSEIIVFQCHWESCTVNIEQKPAFGMLIVIMSHTLHKPNYRRSDSLLLEKVHLEMICRRMSCHPCPGQALPLHFFGHWE